MITLYNDTHAVVTSRMNMGNQTLTLQPDATVNYRSFVRFSFVAFALYRSMLFPCPVYTCENAVLNAFWCR